MLDDFPGTILLVTHDRYLVDRLASQLWIIEPDGRSLRAFKGTWAQYSELREKEREVPQARQAKDKTFEAQRQAKRDEQRARREREAHEQRLAETEADIHRLEQELRALEDEIAAATAAQEALRLHELGTLYAELQAQLQVKLDLWAEMAA